MTEPATLPDFIMRLTAVRTELGNLLDSSFTAERPAPKIPFPQRYLLGAAVDALKAAIKLIDHAYYDCPTDTKRLQVSTSVNIRSAEKLGLVDDARESAAPLSVDLPQETLPIDQTCKESAEIFTDGDLRTRIADALRNLTGDLTYEAMADAVICELAIYEEEMGTGAARRTRIVSDWEKP